MQQAYNIMNEEQFGPTQAETLALLSQTLGAQTVGKSQQRLIRLKKDKNFVRTLIEICLGKHIEQKFKQLSLVIIKSIVIDYFNERQKLQMKSNTKNTDKTNILTDSQTVQLILSNLIRIAYQLPDVHFSNLICSILLKFVDKCSIWDLSQLGLNGLQCESEWQKYVYIALVLETLQFYSNSITQGANKNKVLQKQIGIIASISDQQIINLKARIQSQYIQTMAECPTNCNISILLKCLQILHFAVNPSFQQVAIYIYPVFMIASITLQTLLQFQNINIDIQNVQLSIHFCLQIIKQSYRCSMDPALKNSCQAIVGKQCCQNSLLLINALLQSPIVQIQQHSVHLPDSISKCLKSIALAQPDAKILILSNSSSILRTLLRYFVIDPHQTDMCDASFREQTIKNRQGIISLIQIILQTQSQLSLQICAQCKFSDSGDYTKMELPLYIIRLQVIYFYSCIRQLIGQILPALKICEPVPSIILVKIHAYEILIKIFALLSEEQIKELSNVIKIDIVNHIHLRASMESCPEVKNACLQLMMSQLRLLVAIYKHEQPASSNFNKFVRQGYYIILDLLLTILNPTQTNHIAQYKQLLIICTELLNFSFDLVQHGQIVLKYLFDIYHHQLVALAQSSNHGQQQLNIDELKDESLIIDLCSQSISKIVKRIQQQVSENPHLYVYSKWLYQFGIQLLNLQEGVAHATIENYFDLVCRICFSLWKIRAIVNQEHKELSISLLRIAHQCKFVIEEIIVQNGKTQIQLICGDDQDFMFDGDSQLISLGQSNCIVSLAKQHIKCQYISANICSVVLTTLWNAIMLMGQQEQTQANKCCSEVSKMLMANFKQLNLKQKSRAIGLITIVAIIQPLSHEQQGKIIDFVISQTRMDKQRLLPDNIQFLFAVLLVRNNSIFKKDDINTMVEYFKLPTKISTNEPSRKLALLAQHLLLEMLEDQYLKACICAKIAAICKYEQSNLQNDQLTRQTGFSMKQETPCIPIDCIIEKFLQQTALAGKYNKTN